MKRALRAALVVLGFAVAVLAGLGVRNARISGLFSGVTPGFSGTCRTIPGIPGAGDLALDAPDGLVFIAAYDRRAQPGHPDPRDGLYTMTLAGEGLAKLSGLPADFHPRAISLGRGTDGALTLMAINRRAAAAPSVDIFDVTVAGGAVTLVLRSAVTGGLLVDPDAIAAAGPNSFYVANAWTRRGGLVRTLEQDAMLPGGNVVYFSGMGLRVVARMLGAPGGLAMSPDSTRLYVAAATGREIIAYTSDFFTGELKLTHTLAVGAAPGRLSLDARGALWVAGHSSLYALDAYRRDASARAPSQIFRVAMADGVPEAAGQVYGDKGAQIAAASVGVVSGNRLIIGSALDDRILDCSLK